MEPFIWRTHLVGAVLLAALPEVGGIVTWGVAGPWWDSSLLPAAAALVGAGLLLALPAGWLEAWALVAGQRMLARGVAVGFLVPAWFVTGFPAGFRLNGDVDPIEGRLLVFGWVTYALLVSGQAAAAAWMRRCPFPYQHDPPWRGVRPDRS